ncbi:MAG TPA: hypothetical protein VMC02_15080 [Steroidobacteraceae bacterium]|nr:hypothetical protein [Steroidobacteraceae bacterium]
MPDPIIDPKASAHNTVAMDSHALGTLQYIRASIDAAGLLAVPGSAGIAMGAVGILAAVLVSFSTLSLHWLQVWLIAGLVGIACGTALMAHQVLSRGSALYRGPLRRFLMCLCPPLLVGAVLTWQLWLHGQIGLIPGVWLLMYGCAVMAASTLTRRALAVMGTLLVLLGVAALQLPVSAQNAILGLGFGGLHLLFGILIHARTREDAP